MGSLSHYLHGLLPGYRACLATLGTHRRNADGHYNRRAQRPRSSREPAHSHLSTLPQQAGTHAPGLRALGRCTLRQCLRRNYRTGNYTDRNQCAGRRYGNPEPRLEPLSGRHSQGKRADKRRGATAPEGSSERRRLPPMAGRRTTLPRPADVPHGAHVGLAAAHHAGGKDHYV